MYSLQASTTRRAVTKMKLYGTARRWRTKINLPLCLFPLNESAAADSVDGLAVDNVEVSVISVTLLK